MKRGGPLKRYTRLKRQRAKPRRSGRVRDAAYMDWVRQQVCAMWQMQEHHGGPWDRCSGVRSMASWERAQWARDSIVHYQAAYGEREAA